MSPIKPLPKQTYLTERGEAATTPVPSPNKTIEESESLGEARIANKTPDWSKLKFITRKEMLFSHSLVFTYTPLIT